jgi:hypothetical protein
MMFRRQKAEDRIQETGDGKQGTEDRRQRAEVYPPPAGQKNRAATVRERRLAASSKSWGWSDQSTI